MDADLDDFQQALLADGGNPVETLFRAVSLTAEIFAQEPGFYKAGASALQTETDTAMVDRFGAPRHLLIRDLVTQAVQEGFLVPAVNPESLAFLLGQQFYGWIQAWAADRLSLEDMVTRTQYGFAASLAGFATPGYRAALTVRLTDIQNRLPESWQAKLTMAQAGR